VRAGRGGAIAREWSGRSRREFDRWREDRSDGVDGLESIFETSVIQRGAGVRRRGIEGIRRMGAWMEKAGKT